MLDFGIYQTSLWYIVKVITKRHPDFESVTPCYDTGSILKRKRFRSKSGMTEENKFGRTALEALITE